MKSLIDILDLTVEELYDMLRVANDIIEHPAQYRHACDGKKLATLFFEPSTRTRLSFEAAMYELGGHILSVAGEGTSSMAKGESVADTIRTVSCYADIIAMRHPKEGAGLIAAKSATVPFINAGDGGHCHPTQTLADLLTIFREKGKFEGLTVGICGDLKYGRTVHSLVEALNRYADVRFVLISPEELSMPGYVKYDMEKHNHPNIETTSLDDVIGDLDILYMTRIQRERFRDAETYERLKDSYILTEEKMAHAKPTCSVLHPLPRVNEIRVAIDDDPRACYFKQVANGKYMRMALILKLLRECEVDPVNHTEVPGSDTGHICRNPRCITTTEQELPQRFRDKEGVLRCTYCEHKAKK